MGVIGKKHSKKNTLFCEPHYGTSRETNTDRSARKTIYESWVSLYNNFVVHNIYLRRGYWLLTFSMRRHLLGELLMPILRSSFTNICKQAMDYGEAGSLIFPCGMLSFKLLYRCRNYRKAVKSLALRSDLLSLFPALLLVAAELQSHCLNSVSLIFPKCKL